MMGGGCFSSFIQDDAHQWFRDWQDTGMTSHDNENYDKEFLILELGSGG